MNCYNHVCINKSRSLILSVGTSFKETGARLQQHYEDHLFKYIYNKGMDHTKLTLNIL